MLWAGVMADRVRRRRLLVLTQAAMLIQAMLLTVLSFAGVVRPWHLLALAFCLGAANAFDAPARQAFVLEMVDRESLTNAIALNSTIFNAATTLGPAAAGIVYAEVGPGWCFSFNALSFVAVIAALLSMRLAPPPARAARRSAREELLEGLRFVASHPLIRLLMIGLGATAMLGLAMMTLMPAWSVDVLGGGSRTNGILYSARGVGSLIGALLIASLGRLRRGSLLTLGTFALPLLMMAFAATRQLSFSAAALACCGLGFMLVLNMMNALVQLHTPDELRGRVMSIYTLVFFGLAPLGALLAGGLASHLGAPVTVLLNAGGLLLLALVLALRFPIVRRAA